MIVPYNLPFDNTKRFDNELSMKRESFFQENWFFSKVGRFIEFGEDPVGVIVRIVFVSYLTMVDIFRQLKKRVGWCKKAPYLRELRRQGPAMCYKRERWLVNAFKYRRNACARRRRKPLRIPGRPGTMTMSRYVWSDAMCQYVYKWC